MEEEEGLVETRVVNDRTIRIYHTFYSVPIYKFLYESSEVPSCLWIESSHYVHGVTPPHFDADYEEYAFLKIDDFIPYGLSLYVHRDQGVNIYISVYSDFELIPSVGLYAKTITYHQFSCYIEALPFVVPEPPCCYPDFSSIVKTLGGSPSSVQLDNLKSICLLLGVDTSNSGLKDCDLMKDYLKRLVSFFGGSPSSEPNDNLKSICQLLDIDTADNGLKDCDLSKHYVKQISNMLGGDNA